MKAGDRHSWKAHRKMFYGVKKQGETAWAGPKGPSTLPASVLKADTRQLPSQAIFKQRGFREISAPAVPAGVPRPSETSPKQPPPHHTDTRGSRCWGSLGRIRCQAPHGAAATRRAWPPDPRGQQEGWGIKREADGMGTSSSTLLPSLCLQRGRGSCWWQRGPLLALCLLLSILKPFTVRVGHWGKPLSTAQLHYWKSSNCVCAALIVAFPGPAIWFLKHSLIQHRPVSVAIRAVPLSLQQSHAERGTSKRCLALGHTAGKAVKEGRNANTVFLVR